MRMNALILLLVIIGSVCASCTNEVAMGDPIQDLVLSNGLGDSLRLSQLQSKYVLIEFWGSWCAPCLQDAPNLVAFQEKYQAVELKDGHRLEVVSIALERGGDQWRAAADRFGFDWAHQYVEYSRFVRIAESAAAFGVTDIPARFLIGPEGTILVSKGSWQEIEVALGVE